MKAKLSTAAATVMLFIPWTILILRTYDWALESPAAEIIVVLYAAFMIFSGIFTICAYRRSAARGRWLQLCTVINTIYAVGAFTILCMMAAGRF